MDFRRSTFVLALCCACDTTAPPAGDGSSGSGGHTDVEPLPPELVAACPDAEDFERSGKNECTQIGCLNGYSLNVSPASRWAPGTYRFELTLDGRAVVCQGSLPLQPCAERSFSCDADGARLGESGCALDATQQGIASIMFDGYPLALSVRVLKDGAELTTVELTPAYKAGQPNGPGCEPVCCGASGELAVPVNGLP